MKLKKVIITGACGQDGYYLSRLLARLDIEIIGIVKKLPLKPHKYFNKMIKCNLKEFGKFRDIVLSEKPDVIFNLGAPSSGQNMDQNSEEQFDVNLGFVFKILNFLDSENIKTHFIQASSSEVFALNNVSPQIETSNFRPKTIYGLTKATADFIIRYYREVKNLKVSSAILYNHESPIRREEFVTKKITSAAAEIYLGHRKNLKLGSIDVRRDWLHAIDVCEGLFKIAINRPNDYIISRGKTYSIKDVLFIAFNYLGLDYQEYVVIDKKFNHSPDIIERVGDNSKIKLDLKWKPSISFERMIIEMVRFDLRRLMTK